MKTRAAVQYAPGEPIRVEEIELDPPGVHEVQVRMVAAGVCHSDYHVVTGELPSYLPMALGHEGAGIIEALGPGVTNYHVGDHVVLSFMPSCGICPACTSGHANLCDRGTARVPGALLEGTYRMHNQAGTNVGQFCFVSTFSEHTVVPDISLVPIHEHYALNRAVLVGCGVLTGVGAAIHRARVQPGSTVAIVGVGGVGTNIVQGAALAGARTIIAVDIHDFKLQKALELGATHTVNSRTTDPVREIRTMTDGLGVDYAFDAIALSETTSQAYKALAKNGVLVIVGLAPATQLALPIAPLNLVLTQKTIMGVLYGDARPRNDIPTMLKMYESGKLKLDELVTRTYTLDQINEAYADMVAGKIIRGVIEF
ncbi:MAG TPA: Zn-dependent alcohol dehydrogenase [Ktedonobacteraceae bacterium]|nr:Zn-dependent alcohol dehydrogenase [Ktedonobacteraceae bacterium]